MKKILLACLVAGLFSGGVMAEPDKKAGEVKPESETAKKEKCKVNDSTVLEACKKGDESQECKDAKAAAAKKDKKK